MGPRALLVAASAAACAAAAPAPAQGAPRDFQRYSVLTPAGPEEPSPELFRKLKRLVYADHVVGRGEYSAWHLAKRYGTTAMSLQTTNDDEMLILRRGQKVVVHNGVGQLYEVKKPAETLAEIVAKYHRSPRLARRFRESIVKENGLPGIALLEDYEFERGDRVLLPKVSKTFDTYHFPFKGWGWGRISSRFGRRYHPLLKRRRFHPGLDLAKPYGTPVYPARTGRVIQAGWREGYGLLITIRHADGATTRYGHLSKIYVKRGSLVRRGRTLIGRVGSTGIATGPHLHFEVRDRRGRPVNPGAKIGRR